jgi:3-ketosteroid 9alpha-monooxygenase subunit A
MDPTGSQEQLTRRNKVSLHGFSAKFHHPITNVKETTMVQETIQPHVIEANPHPDRYARGWHCLGLASDYTRTPQTLEYFGGKQVAYRGADDKVHVLDGYCPHMGANLGDGCVEGNGIRCPFHFWRWGPDGVCDDIPYAKRIPPKAVIKHWPTLEQNQLLFVWNDEEGRPPIEEQAIPRIDDAFSDEWSGYHMTKLTVNSHPRELMDNMADVAHFTYVHSRGVGGASEFSNVAEGHRYTQFMRSDQSIPGMGNFSRATYQGPSIMETHMYLYPNGKPDVRTNEQRLLVTHTPIDNTKFDLRFGVLIKKDPSMTEGQSQMWVESQVQASQGAFDQDVKIWNNKIQVDNPILCDGDGPVGMLVPELLCRRRQASRRLSRKEG